VLKFLIPKNSTVKSEVIVRYVYFNNLNCFSGQVDFCLVSSIQDDQRFPYFKEFGWPKLNNFCFNFLLENGYRFNINNGINFGIGNCTNITF
jgi:hypothetical protein